MPMIWMTMFAAMATLALFLMPKFRLGGTEALMGIHIAAITLGYLATLAFGALRVAYLCTRLFREIPEPQLRFALRHAFFLTLLAAALTAIGVVIGSVFCPLPKTGSLWLGMSPHEVGGIAILLWNFLVLVVLHRFQGRVRKADAIMLLSSAGNAVVTLGWLGAMEVEHHGYGLGYSTIALLILIQVLIASSTLIPVGSLRRFVN